MKILLGTSGGLLRRLSVVVVAAGSVLAPGSPVQAADDAVPVRSHGYDSGHRDFPLPTVCTLGGVPLNGKTQFGLDATDNWIGSTVYRACVYLTPVPGQLRLYGVEIFTGSIAGCGSGTFTMVEEGILDALDGTPTDVIGTWYIKEDVPGTGAFVGATGGGELYGTLNVDLSSPFYFGGSVSCPAGNA